MGRERVKRVANRVNFNLERVRPLTENQATMFDSDKHIVAHGWAGTGKTFVSTYLALVDILVNDKYRHLTFIRSAVATRSLGFLPGTEKEKLEVYEQPYQEICCKLFGRSDAYGQLKDKGVIRFMSTSFIRGNNLSDSAVVVDEYQNMTEHESESVITRSEGDNNRFFFCGDTHQKDVPRESGIGPFNETLRRMPEFEFVDFGLEDVVRGPLVKSYLKAKYS